MNNQRHITLIAALVFAGLSGAPPARAQSPDLLAVTAWRLQFTYSIQSTLRADGLEFDYRVTASGNGVLERNNNGSPGPSFRGDPNITISVDYMGSAIDSQGCGLVEQLSATGAPNCENPTSLELNEDGFNLGLRCQRVPVTHTFAWQGSCGEQFPYPVDGQPIVDWPWLAQDVADDGGNVKVTFPYPASGVALGGHDVQQLNGFLAPLFTAIAMGTSTPLDYTFDFTLTPATTEDLTLEIESAGYEAWRPSAMMDGAAGAPLDVTAKLVSSTGRPPSLAIAEVVWRLSNTSREPGIAMNYPLNPLDEDEFDLRFADSSMHIIEDNAQSASNYSPEGFTDTIRIEPYDWGGWSELSVTATLVGGRQVVGKVRGAGENGLRLPKRPTTSKVADSWKRTANAMGIADAADSDDKPVGDSTPGDGLTLYQEYRGFYVNYGHVTGDPKRKDFFVRNRAKGAATGGIARFARYSGLKVHRIQEIEMSNARVMNNNRRDGPSVTDQHAVILEVRGGQSGYAQANGGPGNPKKISYISIMGDWATLSADYLSKTVAHELFHAVNVYHHGALDHDVTFVDAMGVLVERRGGGPVGGQPIRVLRENGFDVTQVFLDRLQTMPNKSETWWLGVEHGQQSGASSCVMRYDNALFYESMANRADRYFVVQQAGPSLCAVTEGTGPNAPDWRPQSRFGSAAMGRGNCMAQMLVTDAVEPPGR